MSAPVGVFGNGYHGQATLTIWNMVLQDRCMFLGLYGDYWGKTLVCKIWSGGMPRQCRVEGEATLAIILFHGPNRMYGSSIKASINILWRVVVGL